MRKQISRVWKDLLTVILLVSCRIKTINRIQFLWWVSSGVFSSLTPGSVLAHLPPSVHPSYHPSIISVLAIYWRPPLYLGYALLTEEYGTRTGEKLQSPLSSTFLSSVGAQQVKWCPITMERVICFSQFTSSMLISPRNTLVDTQKNCLARYLNIPWPSQVTT